MSAKKFFKSTAFKCIVVLLAIVLVCGVFLTICNSLFYVTDQERLDRAVAKIYGKEVSTQEISFTEEQGKLSDATITQAILVKDDGNYLIKSTGNGGFSGGTVTCWVLVKMSGNTVTGVEKVVYDSNTSQTQMAELKSDFYSKFVNSYRENADYSPDDGYLVTGSTKSSTAVCNSVNGALIFVKTVILGQSIADPLEGFEYTSYISSSSTSFEVQDDGSVKFSVTTKGIGYSGAYTADIIVAADGTISSFTVTKQGYSHDTAEANFATILAGKNKDDILALIGTPDGSYKESSVDSSLQTGATQSNFLCLYAGLFATANYEKVIAQGGNA